MRAVPDGAADAIANIVGLLFQTVDATAGLAGNAVVRLIRDCGAHDQPLSDVVADVVETDLSVHNTRRFFAEPAEVGGVTIEPGDTALLVLAAANRGPTRAESLSFGAGGHRCPAGRLAPRIAELAINHLLDVWPGVLTSIRPAGYRPLPNVRIPAFT